MRKKISVVIPTYNEEANVVPLSQAIIEVMEKDLSEYDYEILFIDNHSKDNTKALLRGLCANNRKIKAIFNAKNFGQASRFLADPTGAGNDQEPSLLTVEYRPPSPQVHSTC